jgi:hypothetical protein
MMREPSEDEVIDALLIRMGDNVHSFNVPGHLKELYGSRFCDDNYKYYVQSLKEHGLATVNQYRAGNDLIITYHAHQILKNGGWLKHCEEWSLKEQEEEKRKKLELESLRWTTQVNKWLFKTRWLPHLLALAAFIVSIIAIIKK